MKRAQLKRKGRGVLVVVALLFLGSAVLRLAIDAGPALANVGPDLPDVTDTDVAASADEGSFLAALQAREAALSAREAAFADRLAEMQRAEVEMDNKLQQLRGAEQAIRATIAMAETASQSDVAQLTTVYENMKPKEAAALFAEMSPEFAAGFLGMMRPEAAALIMTQLEPETAYSFSVVLAGRNANTPTQ